VNGQFDPEYPGGENSSHRHFSGNFCPQCSEAVGVKSYCIHELTGSSVPYRLADLHCPPARLFVVGELPRGPSVAVVGTRKPTPDALQFAKKLVEDLASAGLSIWSGGAEGIDSAAHEAALRVGAKTVVVAPAGWNRPYPEAHGALYRAVVDCGGAYLSLVEPDRPAQPHQFFARNAVLVALAQAVVIVQAGLRSGARNAAKTARQLGRPLFAVPSSPWIHQGLGCNLEIALGAHPIGSAKELMRRLAPQMGLSAATSTLGVSAAPCSVPNGVSVARGPARVPNVDPTLEAELARLLDEIFRGARTVDSLCQRTGWSTAVVQSDVLRLTLLGQIRVGRSGVIETVSG